ncbi:MAG TPA: hypothetical protein VFV98_12815 [Vicinamibacterales bacterium]|nr:hypothetical protein [Vicinamibacterales bacterium]
MALSAAAVLTVAGGGGLAAQQAPPAAATATPVTSAEITAAIGQLGSFDFAVRTQAARTIRRAPAATASPLLADAVRAHKDSYVRFRSLVLLTALDEKRAAETINAVIGDRDDRLRTVSYQWYEHHPDPSIVPALVSALPGEQSEFVRPALTRALAAHGAVAQAQTALRPLVMRGPNLFRGAAITALGDYKGTYALADIVEVARLDGPLQEDAIMAIGRLGDPSSRNILASLQKTAPPEALPAISGALCLLGIDVASHEAYLKKTLAFALTTDGFQPLLRGVVHALGANAARGNAAQLEMLIDAGVTAKDPGRDSVALGVGIAALRNPELFLKAIETRANREPAIKLVRDAFDLLGEDFEEERFYVTIRRAFWAAPEASARRQAAQALIDILEF